MALAVGCQTATAPASRCRRDAECSPGLICALGACRGACRESRDCAAAERCLVEPATGAYVCSIADVDDCSAHGCPDGLVCASGACVNACGTVVACPDGVCRDDVCVRIASDAGPRDGGPDDAPTTADAGIDGAVTCHGPSCDPVVRVAVGGGRVLAVTASGALWGWGRSAFGTLGDGVIAHSGCVACSTRPVRALDPGGAPIANVVAASAAYSITCALLADGTVRCWGRNFLGQRGDGQPDDGSLLPGRVVASDGAGGTMPLDHVTAIATGDDFTCALRDTHDVWCWGAGGAGQLGTGGTVAFSNVALHATELGADVTAIAAAGAHVVAIGAGGVLRGVGDVGCAELGGIASSTPARTAVTLPFANVASVALTADHTCALTSGSPPMIRCWGMGTATLGDSMPTLSTCASCARDCTGTPAPIAQPTTPITRLLGPSAGTILGLSDDGSLFAWGGNYDEPYDGITTPEPVSLAHVVDAHVSSGVACAVTDVGDVLCWGGNDVGQLGRGTVSSPTVMDPVPRAVVWP